MTDRRPNAANVRRLFLGWDGPVLPRAVAELVARFRIEHVLDLGRVVVVVPGKRAQRRLCELLVDAAAAERLRFTPPEVVTESRLPEKLYPQRRPFASSLVQALAWTAAARALDPAARAALLPHAPADDEPLRWLRLGELLGRVDAELAADGHDIDAVLAVAAALSGFADRERWLALRAVQKTYHARLHEVGLWDQHAARRKAIERNEVATDREIVLLSTVDLNAQIVRMLEKLAAPVTVLIAAPKEESHRFDAFGRLVPEAWSQVRVPIADEQIHFADGPTEQAARAAAWLGELGDEYSVEEVVIGVPDPGAVPALRRRLQRGGAAVRWLEERTLADTAPFRLLAAAADYLSGRSYEAFAALVRHPDLEAYLREAGTPLDLAALDAFHADCLPARIDATRGADLRPAIESVERWLDAANGERSLREWADAFAAMLKAVYGARVGLNLDDDADRALYGALKLLVVGLDALREVPAALDVRLAAADAFAAAFAAAAAKPIPPRIDPAAVELLGWLELPLDDARAVLVLSFNDGFVPKAAGAEPFLPDELRTRLGIENDARRYARDAYAATVLARSKARFGVVVARRDAQQNPLVPSRLLFTGDDAEVCARANRWSRGEDAASVEAERLPAPPSPFRVPAVLKSRAKRNRFRTSELRDYLACPYRYYLRHVVGLGTVNDGDRELGGGAFGKLIHDVLGEWGRDAEWRTCGDAVALAANLGQRLQRHAVRFRGGRPAVRLQLLQAERRLSAFARVQAELVAAGWRIVDAELDGTCRFDLDSGAVSLTGRIDRIDFHAELNTVRLIDYKTADTAAPPEKAHVEKGQWIDLQLPLFRHLWRKGVGAKVVPTNAVVELCCFQLPRTVRDATLAVATWDEAALASADDCARTVLASIRAEEFDALTKPPPKTFAEFAAICLDNQMMPALSDDGGDA